MISDFKHVFRRLFWIFISWIGILIVFFLVTELFFRMFRKESNPLAEITQQGQDFLFPPGIDKHLKSSIEGEFKHSARINRLGYRGEDFNQEKEKGRPRIIAVGDSFIFGVGAEDNETIPFILEQRLRSQGVNAQVINAGIGNTSPIRHYVNLRDVHLKYHPDLVVLFLDLTDLWDDWHFERNAVYDKTGEINGFNPMIINGKRDWWITATYYSSFCRYMNNRMVRTWKKIQVLGFKKYFQAVIQGKKAKALIATSKEKSSREAAIEYDGLLMLRGKEKESLIREHWDRSAKYLTKIKGLLAERHIPLIIVMYPHGIYVDGHQWNSGAADMGI